MTQQTTNETPARENSKNEVVISLPIRVIGFDEARGRFIEDTHTIVVSTTGSLIALQHSVFPADIVRIINLEEMLEADFRVVGPSIVSESGVGEWGVECNEKGREIWGPEIVKKLKNRGAEQLILIQCRACGKELKRNTTLLEQEVLASTGMIALECPDCKKPTYWTYAEASRRPAKLDLASAVAPPPRIVPIRQRAERRAVKRVLMNLPVLVRNARGQEEVTQTFGLSKSGATINLAMELNVGDAVIILCPYSPSGVNIEQQANVRWKDKYPCDGKRYYGFCFVPSASPRR